MTCPQFSFCAGIQFRLLRQGLPRISSRSIRRGQKRRRRWQDGRTHTAVESKNGPRSCWSNSSIALIRAKEHLCQAKRDDVGGGKVEVRKRQRSSPAGLLLIAHRAGRRFCSQNRRPVGAIIAEASSSDRVWGVGLQTKDKDVGKRQGTNVRGERVCSGWVGE